MAESARAYHDAVSEQLAMRFHKAYERLAPQFGYRTREASAKPWADVPADNKALMIAVCGELLSLPEDDSVVDSVTAINALSRHVLNARAALSLAQHRVEELERVRVAASNMVAWWATSTGGIAGVAGLPNLAQALAALAESSDAPLSQTEEQGT